MSGTSSRISAVALYPLRLLKHCTVGRFRGSGGGSLLNLKSLNYVLVCYSLSFVSIMQVFKCSYSQICSFIVKFKGELVKK